MGPKVLSTSTSSFTSHIISIAGFICRRKLTVAVAVAAAAAAGILTIAGCGGVQAGSASGPTPTPASTPPAATPSPTPAASSVTIPTWHMNNGRTGLNDQETQLTPA
ncbi:MAG: hypothetical protein WA738_16210, partial [Candidatus Angelobacter sp.]